MPPRGERRGRGPEVFTDMHKWTDIRRRIMVKAGTQAVKQAPQTTESKEI